MVTLKVADKTIELTLDQAKALKKVLEELFPTSQPSAPIIIREPAITPPRNPWKQPDWPSKFPWQQPIVCRLANDTGNLLLATTTEVSRDEAFNDIKG